MSAIRSALSRRESSFDTQRCLVHVRRVGAAVSSRIVPKGY